MDSVLTATVSMTACNYIQPLSTLSSLILDFRDDTCPAGFVPVGVDSPIVNLTSSALQ